MKPIHSVQALLVFVAAFASGSALAQSQTLFDLSSVITSGDDQNAFPAVRGANSGFDGNFGGTTPEKLVFTNGGTSAGNGDYFILKLSDYATLETPGQKLTLSFTVTGKGIRNHTGSTTPFRFGLFDVGDVTETSFSAAKGFDIFVGRTNSTSSGLFERNKGGQSNLWAGAAGTQLSDSADAAQFNIGMSNPVVIKGNLSFELTEDNTIIITSTLNGLKYSTETAASLTAFNAISFFTTYSSVENVLTFDELMLASSFVPEPTTTALLATLLASCGALLLRRRGKRS